MDHSIKKKPEKPKLVQLINCRPTWKCYCDQVLVVQPTGRAAYLLWKQFREEKGARP